MSSTALAPWISAQAEALLTQRGHAWLLAGPSGLGQYSLALELVRAWLCDKPSGQGSCGACGSCHAIDVRTHADLFVLMPETVMLELGWPLSEKAQSDIDDKKRKASKEIRVEAMRDAVEFSQRTSARGGIKAVLVFPAERMNHVTANALLKTLEEPPGDVKFVLGSEAAHQLLPTIRSRCLSHTMAWPRAEAALAWLEGQGMAPAQSAILLRAAGGRPADALLFAQSGRDAQSWVKLPKSIKQGDISVFKDWTPAQAVDALHKLCHDVMAVKAGASPRFFESTDLPAGSTFNSLTAWAKALAATTRTVEHPFNAGLMLEALVSQAQSALNSRH
ncbi:MAG: DNA polymerase III subunit delta' [Comamonadaceae bacterium]